MNHRFLSTLLTLVLLASCASTTSNTGTSTSTSTTLPVETTSQCPSTIVVQTSDQPMADLGFLYQLLPDDAVINAETQSIRGTIATSNPSFSGIALEIRHGGAQTNFESVSSMLYDDPSITLGLIDTDEAIAQQSTRPTVAVFAPYIKSPDILFWDKNIYPKSTDIADFKNWDLQILYSDGAYFMDYLISANVLYAKQAINTADGTPISFIASAGRTLQQGVLTVDPYAYRYVYKDWLKQISFQLVHDMGWRPYPLTVSLRASDIATYKTCLGVLVPLLQQAHVDFLRRPESAISRIVNATRTFDNDWFYSAPQARAAVEAMWSHGLVVSDLNQVAGQLDSDRVENLVDIFSSVYPTISDNIKNVKTESIVNTSFIDESIVLTEQDNPYLNDQNQND